MENKNSHKAIFLLDIIAAVLYNIDVMEIRIAILSDQRLKSPFTQLEHSPKSISFYLTFRTISSQIFL